MILGKKEFKDWETWGIAKDLVVAIYKIVQGFPDHESLVLGNFIKESAVSLTAILARAGESGKKKWFKRARNKAKELSNHLLLAKEVGLLGTSDYKKLNATFREVLVGIKEDEKSFEKTLEKEKFFSHPTAIIDKGAKIGAGTKIWHFSHIMGPCIIGSNCIIGQNVFVASQVQLGTNVKVQNNVSIYTGVICEADVFLGPSMVFTNVTNPRSGINRKDEFQETLVKKGASIGANATIICGITIGQYAFIGAGAVVTKNVPDFALMTGNPACQNGWMSIRGHRLEFDENGEATCPSGGEKYLLEDSQVFLAK